MPPKTDIRLEFSTASFKALLDSVAIAQWVVCAGDECESNLCKEVDQLLQNLLCHAAEAGFSDMVSPDAEDAGRLCHQSFEQGNCDAWRAVEHHDEEMFWEELICRMVPVMAKRIAGKSQRQQFDVYDQETAQQECESRLRESVSRHGIGGLMMVSADPAG